MKVSISERAWEDVRQNVRWWSEHRSAEQAARWYDDIRSAFVSLEDRPEQWPVARESPRFPYEIREYHFRISGQAIQRIVFASSEEEVIVLRVVHVKEQELDPDQHPNPL